MTYSYQPATQQHSTLPNMWKHEEAGITFC